MKLNAQTLKATGAAIVVCAAFAIMLPGFVSYALSLSRVMILIATVLVVAVVLGQVVGRMSRPRAGTGKNSVESPAKPPGGEPGSDAEHGREAGSETELSSAQETKIES